MALDFLSFDELMTLDDNRVVTTYNRSDLTVEDFKTLRPCKYLSDAIVEAGILKFMENSGSKDAVLLPLLYKKMHDQKHV